MAHEPRRSRVGFGVSVAAVLRGFDPSVRLQADGWHASRAVEIARMALAYVANPADRLAALGLFDEVAKWPDGAQARANLLRLLAEAGAFMDANREALAHGGFHGSGVLTFLGWLAETVQRKEGDRQAEARVLDEDAVELATWHAAKGREWPVVAVCGLERSIEPKLPDLALGYRSFDDLSRVLEQARIEYAPAFAAEETNERFKAERRPVEDEEARRLLYVALTRPRDKLILESPAYLEGKDGATYWSILTGVCGLSLVREARRVGSETLRVGDATFPCVVSEGAAALPEDFDVDAAPQVATLPPVGRRAIRPGTPPARETLTPDGVTPSSLVAAEVVDVEVDVDDVAGLEVERYGAPLELAADLPAVALGTFLHRCFEILGPRPDLLERIPAATGVPADASMLAQVAGAVAAFERWLAERFEVESVRREWPLLALNAAGSVVSGTADLIVRTPEGAWIFDHKSDAIEDAKQAFLRYRPQLDAYAAALASGGERVAGVAIHWVRRGEVVVARI